MYVYGINPAIVIEFITFYLIKSPLLNKSKGLLHMCKYSSAESSIDLKNYERASRLIEKPEIQTSMDFDICFKDTCYLFYVFYYISK
ncbi:hypothetical protein EMIT0180MI3_10469 [Priestia megaterium]